MTSTKKKDIQTPDSASQAIGKELARSYQRDSYELPSGVREYALPDPNKGCGNWDAFQPIYGIEDALDEMCEELPSDGAIDEIAGRLRIATLRRMMAKRVKDDVRAARNPGLYPFDFVQRLSEWIATAQESIAAKRGVAAVLRDREQMKQRR